MKFPGAPYGLKMACGENPKRTYGTQGRLPSTNMGNVLGYRKAWIEAVRYAHKWEVYRQKLASGESADAPDRDLGLDTLAGVLAGRILVQNHCYRADEMATMLDIADEFGYRITAFHHAVEAYKIAPLLAKRGVCSAIWAERGGTKMEAIDGIGANAAIAAACRRCVVIHSDDTTLIQRLNQETAIAIGAGAARRHSDHARAGDRLDHRRIRRVLSASPNRPVRSSAARWRTSCCGAAIPSAATRSQSGYSSMARSSMTGTTGASSRAPISSSASPAQENFIHEIDVASCGRGGRSLIYMRCCARRG